MWGFFLFLRELISLVTEGGSTIQICGSHSCKTEVNCQRVFSSLSSPPVFLLLMTFFPRFNTLEMGPPKKESGGRGAREPSKEKEKKCHFQDFFFLTPETLQTVVCFICMCLSSIWGRGRDRHIKLGQLHVTQAVLNQNEHLSPECLCGSQEEKKKALGLPHSVSVRPHQESNYNLLSSRYLLRPVTNTLSLFTQRGNVGPRIRREM